MKNLERWLPVVGLKGHYEVSDKGHVRSVDREKLYTYFYKKTGVSASVTRKLRGRVLKPMSNEDGYLTVGLGAIGGLRKVHHLVLEAFIGPKPPGYLSCHENDIPSDNRLGNLRWDTKSANSLDAIRNGRIIMPHQRPHL